LLRAVGLNRADAVNADVGRIRSLPGQRRRHAFLNAIRAR
jgi:hypothetical protein